MSQRISRLRGLDVRNQKHTVEQLDIHHNLTVKDGMDQPLNLVGKEKIFGLKHWQDVQIYQQVARNRRLCGTLNVAQDFIMSGVVCVRLIVPTVLMIREHRVQKNHTVAA